MAETTQEFNSFMEKSFIISESNITTFNSNFFDLHEIAFRFNTCGYPKKSKAGFLNFVVTQNEFLLVLKHTIQLIIVSPIFKSMLGIGLVTPFKRVPSEVTFSWLFILTLNIFWLLLRIKYMYVSR